MRVVEIQAERIHVPLQRLLETRSTERCFARFLAGSLSQAFAPSCLDVVTAQHERTRSLALVGQRRGKNALDRLAGARNVAKALIDACQALVGLDVVGADPTQQFEGFARSRIGKEAELRSSHRAKTLACPVEVSCLVREQPQIAALAPFQCSLDFFQKVAGNGA